MKKLNESTVKSVGGCQYDKLVALLKEMGYEIEAAQKGARVRIGQTVRRRTDHGITWTVAPREPGMPASAVAVYKVDGSVGWNYFNNVETLSGENVIGYEESSRV